MFCHSITGDYEMLQSLEYSETPRVKIRNFLDDLHTRKEGLTGEEAEARRSETGYNEIPEHKKSLLLKFLSNFWGPIPLMIEVAALLSLLIHHYTDFIIILTLLLVNVVIGFWHDRKADNAIEMLKKRLAPSARVLRDGKWQSVPARELVPGDIIRIRLGDIIPADIRLIEGDYLECDESALSGESLPVEKHLNDNAFSGAVVTRGEMSSVVTATGLNTYFGKTAKLVDETRARSHFEKAILKIGNYLILLAVLLIVLIVMVAVFRHDNVMETLRFAMVLAVASIPVALPAILTITLAVGAVNLTKKKAIVSRLASIEELAGMDILCSDKTGTLTMNKLTIGKTVGFENFSEEDTLLYAALASRREDNDAIDNAILNSKDLKKIGKELDQFKVEKFQPFDSVTKRTEATIRDADQNTIRISKGAPQAIIALSSEKYERRIKSIEKKVEDYAKMGYRVIAVAYSQGKDDWQPVGLIPLFDPPREDSAETIKEAGEMGVQVKMVTGDNVSIARQISQKLGLKTNILRGEKIKELSDHELDKSVETVDGFAEVYPEHKYTIVKKLQHMGHFVGMTGDGVNDAPALKNADCGIAVDGATDAAKSAAAIVLTAPGISVIIDAIKESRKIFQRMNSYAVYRIAETIRVLFFITISILVFNFYPVTAVMIVLLALLNDAPIIAIARDNVKYSRLPEKWNMSIVLGLGTFLGTIGVISSFVIFYLGKEVFQLNPQMLQSFIFLKLAVAGHLTIFISRTRGFFWSIKPSSGLLWSAVLTKILATVFAVYGLAVAPIGWGNAGIVWLYALGAFMITDVLKVYFYRWFINLPDYQV
jgi:H+-transporting ATPase